MLSGQYVGFVYRYLREWRKNPQWSFSCCLALLLPLSDSHGELSDVIETNALTNQLHSGQIDLPTILTAVNDDHDAADANLKKGEQDYGDDSREALDHNGQYIKEYYTFKSKCHQATQTELLALSSTDLVVNEPMKEKLYRSLYV